MGRCGAPCTGAQSVERVRRRSPSVFRAAVDHDPRDLVAPLLGRVDRLAGRGALRGRRACCATASPSWSAPCAAASGWSRWPPSPSWCSPGPTARAAGTCPSSAAAGWSPPAARRAGRRSARRCAGLLATAETLTGPDGELRRLGRRDRAGAALDGEAGHPAGRADRHAGLPRARAPARSARFLARVEARPRRARPVRRRPVARHAGAARAGRRAGAGGAGRGSRLASPA